LYPSGQMTTIRNCAWGPVRSPAELEDLWAIDNAAYAKLQSPTKSSGLVVVLPLRLAGLVFSKPRDGSHRHLAAVKSVLAFAEVGSTERIAIDGSLDARLHR
jgi:hypothetical protein